MAADNRSPRDGKHLEVLGYYNPLPVQDGAKRMGIGFLLELNRSSVTSTTSACGYGTKCGAHETMSLL
ncbi:30S ribosomal protein S16-2, chloroplastic/mitochondrial [Trifolium repens]|nr:30S ribosomal protein S16-2, chloroplastic/mitochondrial [Trifolium repens]